MAEPAKTIAVVGAGLVGSVMACYLRKEGYDVVLIERRSDPRKYSHEQGRSINLALSKRGIAALEEIEFTSVLFDHLTPMKGRMMHDTEGQLTFQPYGHTGQYINSVSRNGLNVELIEQAEKMGCKICFDKRIADVSFETGRLKSEDGQVFDADFVIAADGAFSAVRTEMMREPRFNYSQHYINYGYKELTLPAGADGKHQMEVNALHIWPRGNFMLIALPNMDGTYTCTLFLPYEGALSFDNLRTEKDIKAFFAEYFPDVIPLMPSLIDDFQSNPTSSLVTVRCYPWNNGKVLLIGDACHAIVPFYGQGMNAGFEDCRVFMKCLRECSHEWERAMEHFQALRKPDAEAIADLALQNFIEMRDLVADDDFLLRKKIEARLHQAFPDRWIPLYSMVTFHDNMRYSEAMMKGLRQKKVMDAVMKIQNIHETWESLNLGEIVDQLGE